MVKNYIIDTNVMIHDPNFMYNFSDNNIVIPLLCIEELDSLKRREGLVGFHARNVAKELKRLMGMGDISKGIPLPEGGTLRVELDHMHTEVLPNGIDYKKNDSRIIAVALNLSKVYKEPTILVTKDLYMAIKAHSVRLKVEDYKNDKIETDKVYKGYRELTMTSDEINNIYQGGLEISNMFEEEPLYPNEFLHIKSVDKEGHEVIAKYDGEKAKPLKYASDMAWGLKPINREQKMAFELLMDPNVHFVSIIGGAGSGKTILATATALQNVIEAGQYRKIVFVRPVVAAGNDIGYLPGNERDKLKPWMGSFYDAIENLSDIKQSNHEGREKPGFTVEDFIDQFRQQGIIETKTFTYMRGRTFTNSLIIVDEAQEMTPHLAKLMLTRAGQNSKFVFIGDPSDNQIDNNYVDAKSNGLVYTVEKMKEYDITGHIALKRVERSPLAKIAERNM